MSTEENSLTLRPRDDRARITVARAIAIGLAILLNVTVIAAGVWALTNQQRISDQFTVWQFEPSSTVRAYVTSAAMSEEGEFLFYASQPVVQENPEFNSTCSNVEENFGVLGCYFPSSKAIYLFDVTDERLAGIEEVVAAHEMLHAAWDRLSDDERARLTPLLEAEADRMKDDPEFATTLEFYAKTEPGERSNELHSIIGTEFADLSPELEEHYATYFTDRATVVALHEKSNAVFTEQLDASKKLVEQLDALRGTIDDDYATYNSGYDSLNADIDSFNARADRGDFATLDQFNRERNQLINRQDELNALYDTIEANVATYDGLVVQLEDLNATISELNQSINIEPRNQDGI
ncbi:hypothetical protein CLV85_2528 [Salinibacterium amurskyense]|uniref:Uncharacterized protein n=1 Tax=Salinibacterium amurskyense TaxID=205941 RepID=A0A2M9D1Z2_9MICO|nr:hypothetical protein [Salinibacterium amurskyense]PJJ78073.1 hypothetical protein CLV85_2528 [Salinibacterium amurskyense]GHD82468.1 hypothetical protein GCM10007394_18870 [Salinibacterium amurskyense]